MTDKEIKDLINSALENRDKAYQAERDANDRRSSIFDRELKKLYKSASAGNTTSIEVVRQIQQGDKRGFQVSVDTITSNDALWKAHVANNQFYTRKADLDNQMAQTLLKAKEMGIWE